MLKRITYSTFLLLLFFPVVGETKALKVNRVIDGDTVQLNDDRYVRLIGIDAPELTSDECYAKKSKKKLAKLTKDKKVKLKYDEDTLDEYGRTLAYLYVGKKFINKNMVVTGHAEALIVSPNDAQADTLNTAQEKAKEKKRGIWSSKCQSSGSSEQIEESVDEITVSVISANLSLDTGDKGTISLTTSPSATCSVDVSYDTGETDEGLEDETADSNGSAVWEWRVPKDTPPGKWPVTITCSKDGHSGSLSLEMTITTPQ